MSPTLIPTTIADLVRDHVADYGQLDVETGLFLAGPRGSDTVTTVAFAGSRGVERQWGLLTLSGNAITKLLRFLTQQDLVALAQVHSHQGAAFLSRTDLEHGFSVEGFTSAVIPNYSQPPHDPHSWGWWRYQGDEWRPTQPFELTTSVTAVTAVTFDEDGVHATR